MNEHAERPAPRGRRAIQAEQTRADILDAARRRFAANGYAATSLKDIAGDANVSVQTLYDSIGSKAELVRSLNDLVDGEAQVWEIANAIPTETDPLELVRIPARITRRIIERCGDICRAGVAGMQAEPALVPVVAEGGRRHRDGVGSMAARLADMSALREGLDAERAAVTLAAITDFRLALVLLDDHGMSYDEIEAWMSETAVHAVLRRQLVTKFGRSQAKG
jgi:AcrR family transcriptional regulator